MRKIFDYIFLFMLVAVTVWAIRYFDLTANQDGYIAVDGDSINRDTRKFRLYGIDAPELHQTCQTARGNNYPCGQKSRRYLSKLISGKQLACTTLDIDRYGREIAVCRVGKTDINAQMVKAGWALAYLSHSFNYARPEREARKLKRGIWQGKFIEPQDWRAENR